MRTCRCCKIEKPLDEYHNAGAWKDGKDTTCSSCRMEQYRDRHYRKHYGITLSEYNSMLKAQKRRCKICGKKKTQMRKLCVDHCHETGRIRGLLCSTCNTGIGSFYHDPELMLKAIEYIEESKRVVKRAKVN